MSIPTHPETQTADNEFGKEHPPAPVNAAQERRAGLEISVITTDEEFDRFGAAWSDLAEQSDCTVFQTFEWQRAWWRHHGDRRQLYCVVFKRLDEVVAIAPMFREDISVLGIKAGMRLRFFSEWYVDLISKPDSRLEAANALIHHLSSIRKDWDLFEIADMNERFISFPLLLNGLGECGLRTYVYRGADCLRVHLPGKWDLFLDAMGPGRARRYKRRLRKLEENFGYEVETCGSTDEDVKEGLSAFAELYGRRWKSLGYDSYFDSEKVVLFHREVALQMARRGWLRLFFLKVNGTRIATVFDFNYKNHIYGYQANVFGSPEIMKCSPGLLLHYEAARRGIEEGMNTFDLLRGTQAYKSEEFECTSSANWQIRAVSPSWARSVAFKLFIAEEFLLKMISGIREERDAFRRFRITAEPSLRDILLFAEREAGRVSALAFRFLSAYTRNGNREERPTTSPRRPPSPQSTRRSE